MATRLGILGGSFDPVHYGHLLVAEFCREQARLDMVWFMPAATPPHKRERDLSSADDRATMLQLAIGGQESFALSRLELDRGGVSYTVDTLAAIKTEQPDAELFLLMGTDTLHDLPNWREPARILSLATPIVVRRPSQPEPNFDCLGPFVTKPEAPARDVPDPSRLEQIRQQTVTMPLIELSSSEIRRRVAAGQSIRFQTPRAVEQYIRTRDLYRS